MSTKAGSGGALSAVLFDLDGVLVDSFESWLAVVNAAAERFGARPVDRARLAEVFGQGPADDAVTLYPGRSPQAIKALYDELMPREVERIVVGPESRAVLEDLGRKRLLRGVVTNTQVSLARRILEAADLLDVLDAWAGVAAGLKEKPETDLLDHVLAELGVARSEALLVGDSRYDEGAAEAAGMPFVFFDLRAGGSLAEALAPHLP